MIIKIEMHKKIKKNIMKRYIKKTLANVIRNVTILFEKKIKIK